MGGGPDLDGGGGRAGSRIASRLLPIVLQIIAVTIGMGWATKWNATIGIGFQFYCQISESVGEHQGRRSASASRGSGPIYEYSDYSVFAITTPFF